MLAVLGVLASACTSSTPYNYFAEAGLDLPSSCSGCSYIAETGNLCGCTGTFYAICYDGTYSACDCDIPSSLPPPFDGSGEFDAEAGAVDSRVLESSSAETSTPEAGGADGSGPLEAGGG
jgi:hypothetical protein